MHVYETKPSIAHLLLLHRRRRRLLLISFLLLFLALLFTFVRSVCTYDVCGKWENYVQFIKFGMHLESVTANTPFYFFCLFTVRIHSDRPNSRPILKRFNWRKYAFESALLTEIQFSNIFLVELLSQHIVNVNCYLFGFSLSLQLICSSAAHLRIYLTPSAHYTPNRFRKI